MTSNELKALELIAHNVWVHGGSVPERTALKIAEYVIDALKSNELLNTRTVPMQGEVVKREECCPYCGAPESGEVCTHPQSMWPKKSRLTNEWLKKRIKKDPDVDVEAGNPDPTDLMERPSSLPQPVAMGEDEVVEIMAAAAYEEYYRGSGRIHCKWDDATSNERIIHLCEARASIRALLKHAHITKR